MEERVLIGPISGRNVLTDLLTFCVDSVNTCFSPDARKLCAPIVLALLSALLLLLACILTTHQRWKFRGEGRGHIIPVCYTFIGNLCSTIGAVLSRQLYIQVLMGAFAAALDVLHCVLCGFPLLLCWNSNAERRLRMMKKRRRQHLLAVCVLMVVAGGFLRSNVTPAAYRPVSGRKLLHGPLQISRWGPLMDSTEILGYILGMLSFVIACTSRFPALLKTWRGQMLTQAYIVSALLCSLAGFFYTAAILLYDTHFGFLMRVLPWLLSSVGCVSLDLLIVVIHWCRRGHRRWSTRFSSDTAGLLGGSGISVEDNSVMKTHRKQEKLSSAQPKAKKVPKGAKMGHYMDVSVHPAREISLKKELTLCKDEPLGMMVRLNGVDGFCSSDSSYDSSAVSSDLEWDCEAAKTPWNEAKQQEGDAFPLQDWPKNPEPFNICLCSRPGLLQKPRFAAEEGDSSVSLAK
ncbi:transmembrane protein 44 [Parambassis ranga]|uniref:Transmembrane protein 44 n=1 Tax=Parambassis ranga TaxID=210632 RepID=A0A6P7HVJ4_9TELE|nr:transmembrane protein 44 [Parambassis ranga]